MKTLILFLTLSFLMNCYTFKTVATDQDGTVLDQSKTYEIVSRDNKRIIARNVVKNNERYNFTLPMGKAGSIPMEYVISIKERKFAVGKTALLTGGVLAGVAIAIGAALASTLNFTGMEIAF